MNYPLHLAGDVAVWVALAASIAFCITYAAVAPWRASGEGWHLMTFTAVIGLSFAWIAFRQITGPAHSPYPLSTEAPRAAILGALAGLLVWRLALLVRTQVRRRRRAMTEPADGFIPPPAGEPIPEPPPAGATDAGLGGELVDDDLPAFATAAASSGAPTWAQVHALAAAQLAHVVKGRIRENVNPLTKWYYGTTSIAAAWCFIFISWVLAHAAGSQKAGLDLIGGKKAYVPYLPKVKGFRRGHAGMKVGAVVAIAGFSHIGFCTKMTGSSFHLLSGNSTYGSSSDAVTVKSYPLSVVSGYVNVTYATAPAPGPEPAAPGSVYTEGWWAE